MWSPKITFLIVIHFSCCLIRSGGGGQPVRLQGRPCHWVWWGALVRHTGGVSVGCEWTTWFCCFLNVCVILPATERRNPENAASLSISSSNCMLFQRNYCFMFCCFTVFLDGEKPLIISPPRCWRIPWKWSIMPWSCEPSRGWRKTSAWLATSKERIHVSLPANSLMYLCSHLQGQTVGNGLEIHLGP